MEKSSFECSYRVLNGRHTLVEKQLNTIAEDQVEIEMEYVEDFGDGCMTMVLKIIKRIDKKTNYFKS